METPRTADAIVQEIDAPETPRAQSIRCLESAQRLDLLRETIPRRSWRQQVQREWQEWRPALEWSLAKQGNILLGQRLVGALETAWWVLPDDESQRWIRLAFEAADAMTPRNVRLRLNLALARVRIAHHRFKSCHTAAERALRQAREIGDDVGTARAEFLAGHSLVVLGNLAEGEPLLESALVRFRSLGARRSIGRTLASLAFARERADDVLSACSICAQAVETLKAIEGDDGDLDHVSYLAELEFRAGNAEEALRLASEALARHRQLDERLHVVVDSSNAAAYCLALDRYDQASAHGREALGLAIEAKDALWTTFALQHLAALQALRGNAARAATLLGFVDRRFAELQHQREHTEQQEYQRAAAALQAKLPEAELRHCIAEGERLTDERAVSEALAD